MHSNKKKLDYMLFGSFLHFILILSDCYFNKIRCYENNSKEQKFSFVARIRKYHRIITVRKNVKLPNCDKLFVIDHIFCFVALLFIVNVKKIPKTVGWLRRIFYPRL